MKTPLLRIAAFAAAAALASAPAVSQAAVVSNSISAPVKQNYDASFGPIVGFAVPWTGSLQLTFNPDGIINGWYRPDGDLAFIPVTGGRHGQNVWLEIGQMGRIEVNGTLEGQRIVGAAVDDNTQREYSFSAKLTNGTS